MRIPLILCIISLCITCAEQSTKSLDFLSGTWKMEGKEQYEVWETIENNRFEGYSYRIIDGQKTITETLSIKKVSNQFIYEATVPDQNEGETIPFTLNNEIKEYLSFENLAHDFPKKIQYKSLNENEIQVTVTGDEGSGFSFKQKKQIIE